MNDKLEQHSIPVSIALHLLPGVLIGAVFFLLAPTPDQLAASGLILLGLLFLSSVLIQIFTRGRLSHQA